MYTKPEITIPGARIDGKTVTGTFVFPTDVRYELGTETRELFQSQGTTAVITSAIVNQFDSSSLGEGLRQELSFDVGGGVHVIEIDFSNFDGSPHQWGDSGNGGTTTDATGEDVHAQMAVFDKYLQATTLDSTNTATLEIGEYSTNGRYEPIDVVPRNPNVVFDSVEETSVFDGSVAWVETENLEKPIDSMNSLSI